MSQPRVRRFTSVSAARLYSQRFTGNLNPDATVEDVESLFSKFGTISNVWVARRPPGFAFVVSQPAHAVVKPTADL